MRGTIAAVISIERPTTSRLGAIASWVALVGGSVAAIVALHRLAAEPMFAVEWHRLWVWLGEHTVERVLLGLGRAAALVLAYWIAVSSVLYTAARASGVPRLVRSVEWLALPAVRRVAERVVAVSLTFSTLAIPGVAMAATAEPAGPEPSDPLPVVQIDPAPRYVPVPAGGTVTTQVIVGDDAEPGYVPTPAGSEGETPAASPHPIVAGALDPGPERNAADAIGPAIEGPATVLLDATARRTVEPGDHLWGIAEDHLGSVLGRPPSEAELATYWAHLVDANRETIRSGDPDLIFPGEVVTCPPAADVGVGR